MKNFFTLNIIIAYILISVLLGMLIRFTPYIENILINYITVLGTYSSIFGIYLTYRQILSVGQIAKITETEIKQANERIITVLTVSDISKAIKIVPEIQGFLVNKKFEFALMRIKDLKRILFQIKFQNFEDIVDNKIHKKLLSDLQKNIGLINEKIKNPDSIYDFSSAISNLEKIEDLLLELESYLRFK